MERQKGLADSGSSLRQQALVVMSAEANIQVIIKASSTLHRRMATTSPIHKFGSLAASARGGDLATTARLHCRDAGTRPANNVTYSDNEVLRFQAARHRESTL